MALLNYLSDQGTINYNQRKIDGVVSPVSTGAVSTGVMYDINATEPMDTAASNSDTSSTLSSTGSTTGGGSSSSSTGVSGSGGASTSKSLWSAWESDALNQLTNPEGLGDLDSIYGQTLDVYGNQYGAAEANAREMMTASGMSRSPAAAQMYGDFQTSFASEVGTAMQNVALQDITERIRQKDEARANILAAQQSQWQLAGQKAQASATVQAATISAEVGHGQNLLGMMALGMENMSNPYSTT